MEDFEMNAENVDQASTSPSEEMVSPTFIHISEKLFKKTNKTSYFIKYVFVWKSRRTIRVFAALQQLKTHQAGVTHQPSN
jgi:hypothetical protein